MRIHILQIEWQCTIFFAPVISAYRSSHSARNYNCYHDTAKGEPYICTMKILMVCLGNICRSPLAEGILQKKALEAGLGWEVHSAGTNQYHIGSAPHPLSQKVAQLNGIDISEQRARRIHHGDMDDFDVIYAMATDVLEDIKEITGGAFRADKVKLFMHEHPKTNITDVPDPWYGDESGYHEVYQLIDDVCNQIIQTYKSTAK